MESEDHWESVHTSKQIDEVSWWQEPDAVWADLITDLDTPTDAAIIDIGSGSSLLVDALVAAGFTDVTALDISAAALQRIRERLADRVSYIQADVLEQPPTRQYAVWHDRAVFHFLTATDQQQRYAEVLRQCLTGTAIVATFAPDGPESCSGLPVARYTPEQIADVLGLQLRRGLRRVHVTPWGAQQPFSIAQMSR